jgi:hypothetical protein
MLGKVLASGSASVRECDLVRARHDPLRVLPKTSHESDREGDDEEHARGNQEACRHIVELRSCPHIPSGIGQIHPLVNATSRAQIPTKMPITSCQIGSRCGTSPAICVA